MLGAFGSGRGKLALLEVGLQVKADVKLPLQRRRGRCQDRRETCGIRGLFLALGWRDAADVFGAQRRCAFTC